jgi:NADH-quinone oxidoreductase subunit M
VRALEARFGSLSLREHHGYYEQVPGLAICFLVTGLASVGFPGTIGFVPMELLVSGSVEHGLGVSLTLAVAAMLNGIAILRAYFALFTGRRPTTSVSLQVTALERAGIILIVVLVFLGGWFSPGVVASRHDTAEKLLERKTKGPVGAPHR